MTDAVWTEWLENPGTGECPVPEWAEVFQIFMDPVVEVIIPDFPAYEYKWDYCENANITHYRYAVPADLAHIAKHAKPADFIGSIPVTALDFGNGEYRLDDYLRARRDLGYENPEYPERPPNFGCVRQPSVTFATPEEEAEYWGQDEQQAPSKYHRNIKGVWADVYDIIYAYGITNPGDQHAIKKMLQPGKRGYKDARQDREEAIASLRRANELEGKK